MTMLVTDGTEVEQEGPPTFEQMVDQFTSTIHNLQDKFGGKKYRRDLAALVDAPGEKYRRDLTVLVAVAVALSRHARLYQKDAPAESQASSVRNFLTVAERLGGTVAIVAETTAQPEQV
jgi:hypothetical protein